MKKIKVVIIETEPLTSLGIKMIIEQQVDMEVIATYAEANKAINSIKNMNADIAIIDTNLSDMGGLEAVNLIKQIGCKVVVSTRSCSKELLSTAMDYDAYCIFLKNTNPELLIQAIRCAINNDSWIDPQITKNLMDFWANSNRNDRQKYNKKGRSSYEPLTKTEIEILKLIACGYSNTEIAKKTYKTLPTIRCHTSSIYSKLGVNNRVRALIKGIKYKYLEPDDFKDIDEEDTTPNCVAI